MTSKIAKLEELQKKVIGLKSIVEVRKSRCKSIQKDLDEAESSLIEAKESLRKAEEAVELYKNTQVFVDIDELARNKDIEKFRQRLPLVIQKLDAQELNKFKHKIDLTRKVDCNGNVKCDENSVA